MYRMFFIICALMCTGSIYAQQIENNDWEVYSEDFLTSPVTELEYKGEKSIKLDSKTGAIAWNKKVNLKNFKIDLDIAGAVMSGIGFHVENEQNYQFLYFRPGYGNTQEAIQYIPIYNGGLSWVMYNYPTYEKTADIKSLEWFHATLEVRDGHLKVFVNNSQDPQMDIPLLNASTENGSILLRSMFGETYFSNITITQLPSALTEWEISDQFTPNAKYQYNDIKKVKKWSKINGKQDKVVNLLQYFDHPNGTIFAKKTIFSEDKEKKILYFDFIGKLKIFLNGNEVFNYGKQRLVRLEEGQYQIQLDLEKGENELVLISEGDAFIFGEGFKSMGRFQHQNWGFLMSL